MRAVKLCIAYRLPLVVSASLVTMGFAADAPTADLSEQLMNRDNCLFNRISVVILQGKVSPRNMQTVEFASLKKIDPRTLNVAYPGAYKPPLLLQIKRTNGRYLGYVETVKGPITLLECD